MNLILLDGSETNSSSSSLAPIFIRCPQMCSIRCHDAVKHSVVSLTSVTHPTSSGLLFFCVNIWVSCGRVQLLISSAFSGEASVLLESSSLDRRSAAQKGGGMAVVVSDGLLGSTWG